MATVKVFDVNGVKQISCFDTLDDVDYLSNEIVESEQIEDDVIDF